MCKYCTLRRYKDGPIRSMKTWRGGYFTTAYITWSPEYASHNHSPFELSAEIGWNLTSIGITHCPWCGKELKPPKSAKD